MTLTLEQVLAALETDRALHMLGDPCEPEALVHVEEVLGLPLPWGFRLLLERLGGGIFYEKHEIFGGRRLMVHDIEMVPDLLSVRRSLGVKLPPHLVPFHRSAGVISLLDLRDPKGRVLPVTREAEFVELATFLETVVLGSRPATGVAGR